MTGRRMIRCHWVESRVGRAGGDPYLEAKGQGERASGAARQVTEQAKDAGRNVRDALKE